MNVEALKTICEAAINSRVVIGLDGPAMITLQMPGNPKCPKRRKIFRKRGPFGKVVAWGFNDVDTVIFDAQEILDFIKSVGL